MLAQIASLAISPPEGSRYRPVIEEGNLPGGDRDHRLDAGTVLPSADGNQVLLQLLLRSASRPGLRADERHDTSPPADGSILLSWQLRGSVLYGAVEVALLSFREPFKRINQHMGWGRLEYDLWHARTARALNMVTRRGAWHLQTAMSATAAGGTGTGPGPG